uniref:DUF3668 domain-containing protein n=1 Tax=Branchiostoma floridae TaxID=7739 RepID=C3Y204_BRAFL|eukprot:XP_002609884.1 hypothetical protein BRAFLDRAFT_90733 [Branchiostoma floridae]
MPASSTQQINLPLAPRPFLSNKPPALQRLQRTPIKLQCYAVDTLTSAKEAVGYVIIDIRQAKQDDPTPSPRWYSLLSSKYSRYKPEIRASISIETDSADKKDISFRAKDSPPRDDIDPRTLKARLNEEEGYYQVGPADRCTQHFVLSVTVAFASNLPQRTPIKLQCYAVDTLTSAKEAVGYVIIDIRQAKQDDPTPSPRWYSLLSSKYSRYKPEIRASISIETDSADKKDISFRAKDAPPRDDIDPRTLKARLNEEEGYYQVGPADRCTQHFVLSVTVAFASNLPQLVPMSMPLPSRESGFFFYYSLLGNDVTNESFHNLLNPDFPAERASVRVRSSVQVLRLFLAAQPGLQIHLCCGDHSLGSTEVPLNTLLKSASDLLDKPASLEGSFVLNPPNRVKQQLPPVGGDMVPSVGVSITLRQDTGSGAPSQPSAPTTPPKEHPITPIQPREPRASDKISQTPPPGEQPPPPPQGHTPPQRLPRSPPVSPSSDTQETEQGLSSLGEDVNRREDETAGKQGKRTEDLKLQEPTFPLPTKVRSETKPPVVDSAPSSVTTSQPYVSIPPAAHHFCFSLDLRSIQDVETSMSAPLYIFLRWL